MANELHLRTGLKLPTTLASGAGHEVVTISPSGIITKIPAIDTTTFVSSTLAQNNILVGSATNEATAVAMSGDATIDDTGALEIANDVIDNANISSIANIALSKLASITADRAVISDGLGKLIASSVTATELGQLSGVTSPLQAQIDGKLSATVVGPATGDLLVYNGTTWVNFPKGTDNYTIISTPSGIAWAAITPPAVPLAGTADQILAKVDGTDYNTYWMTLTLSKITDITATAAEVNILAGQSVTATEFSYLTGLSSNIQTQLLNKQDLITGAASTITTSNLSTNRALYSDGGGKVAASTVTLTELNYVSGVTGPIQNQLANKLGTSLSTGAIWIGNGSGAATQLAAGTDTYVLTMVAGSPAWAAAPGGGGATWGSITGTLASQTDLQAALDLKAPTSRQLTINGVAFDLTADRTWTIPTFSGTTGTVDNAVLRADGSGGSTFQSSAVVVTDTGDIDLGINASTAGTLRTLETKGLEANVGLSLLTKGAGTLSALSNIIDLEGTTSLQLTSPYVGLAHTSTTVGGELRIIEGSANGTNYVALKAPDAITSTVTYTLPEAPAVSGYVLSSTTGGAMSWIPTVFGNFWDLGSGGALTADNTISGAFNIGFTNTQFGIGVAPASITANTKLDVRGIAAGNIQRWASDTNAERGVFKNDGTFRVGAADISGSVGLIQGRLDGSGAQIVAHLANKTTGGTTTATTLLFENDTANTARIQLASSNGSSVSGGPNAFSFGTSQLVPVAFFTNQTTRYIISGGGAHTWQNNLTTGTNTDFTFLQGARTGGIPTGLLFTGGAHTGLNASTESIDADFNLARTVQFLAGAKFIQRAFRIQAPTYSFNSASTITTAYTTYIENAPIAGTNATITNSWALGVAGNTRIIGQVLIGTTASLPTATTRFHVNLANDATEDARLGSFRVLTETDGGARLGSSSISSYLTLSGDNLVGSAATLYLWARNHTTNRRFQLTAGSNAADDVGLNTTSDIIGTGMGAANTVNVNGGNIRIYGGVKATAGTSDGNVILAHTGSAARGALIVGGSTITAGSVLADFQSSTQGIVVPRPTVIANIATPTNGMVAYDATTHLFNFRQNGAWVTLGSIGGSTGATDNAILRANGAGGNTLQTSLVTIDDLGNLVIPDNCYVGSGASNRLFFHSSLSYVELAANTSNSIIMTGSSNNIDYISGRHNLITTNTDASSPWNVLFKRRTTGTHAIGIGSGVSFITETGVANEEIGSTLESIATNIGSGTEAFDLVFKTMTGGAAAIERLRMKSTGQLQFNAYTATGSFAGTPVGYLQFDASGNILTSALPAGSGDVVGPASATDNVIARFDLTTGKLIQDSVVTIGDTGNMTLGNASTSGNRSITVSSSSTDASLTLVAQGIGSVQAAATQLGVFYSGTGIYADAQNNLIYHSNTAADFKIRASNGSSSQGRSLQLLGGDGAGTDQSGGHVYINDGNPTGTGLRGNIGLFITSVANWQSAEKVMFIGNRVADPSTAIANGIALYAKDSSDGSTNSTLALYTEQAPEAAATFTQTHRLKIWVNGVEYWISLDAV